MNVLYLSYTGLLEPLGRSQVLAYLRILARSRRITLVTFEKPGDLADTAAVLALQADCEAHGIVWKPRRYHRRPRLLATAWDLLVLAVTALGEARGGRIGLIHARSYIPAFVAMAVGWLTRTPFIFDMRAFWPEEMIAAGRLRRGSPTHRAIRAGETLCLERAAAVVSLTEAGVRHMRDTRGEAAAGIRFAVVPTCVDLNAFQPSPPDASLRAVGSVGTVLSGWFRFEWLTAFLRVLHAAEPEAEIRIVTREDEARIRAALARGGLSDTPVAAFGVTSAEVPKAVADLSAVAMFFETGVAKLGSCPTRMGEILAVGRPVVANPGVGDVGEIIRRYRVGVLVEGASEPAMRAAVEALRALLKDPDLPARCRAAAEDWFSLEKGAARYAELYDAIAAEPDQRR